MFWHHGFYGLHDVWLIGTIIVIIPFWRICDRAGLSPWLSLLLLIPLANIVFVYYVAFAEWPAQRGSAGGMPPGFGPGATPGPSPGAGSGPTPT